MIRKRDRLDAVGKTQIIILFSQNAKIMEVKPLTEVTRYKENYM